MLQLLKRARELVAGGWVQDFYFGWNGHPSGVFESRPPNCFCLHGAFAWAKWEASGRPFPENAYVVTQRYSHAELDNLFGRDCVGFNDFPGRTQAEVLALLDRKITELSNAHD